MDTSRDDRINIFPTLVLYGETRSHGTLSPPRRHLYCDKEDVKVDQTVLLAGVKKKTLSRRMAPMALDRELFINTFKHALLHEVGLTGVIIGGKRKASEEWAPAHDSSHRIKKARTESPYKEDQV